MKTNRGRMIALLLTVAMMLSLLPAGYALESPEVLPETQAVEEAASETPDTPTEEPETPDTPTEEPETPETPSKEPEAPDTSAEEPETPDTPAAELETPDTSTEEPETPEVPAAEPETPDTPAEEPETPDTPVEEEAQEPPAVENAVPPETEAQQEEASQAQPLGKTQGSYSKLSLTGTLDYGAANDLLKQLTANLTADYEWSSGVPMDQAAMNGAMDRAIELAVLYHAENRPNGESWMTALGDRGVESNRLRASYISAAGDVSSAAAELAKAVQADNYGDAFRGAGVGCFVLPDGSRYWALVLNDYWASSPTQSGSQTGSFQVSYQAKYLGTASLQLSKNTLNVAETATAAFVISNGKGVFTPDGVTYTSSDPKLVTVDDSGKLTGVGMGTATITASLGDTGISASAQVTGTIQLGTAQLTGAVRKVGGVQVTWDPVAGATSYEIYRTTKAKKWSKPQGGKIATISASETTYLDKTVVSGTNYYYTVRACYTYGGTVYRGGYQNPGRNLYYLAAPKISAARQGSMGITVRWGEVSGAKRYDVYRRTNGGKWVKQGSTTGTTYLNVNVTAKDKYTYTVIAVNGSVRSAYESGRTVTASTTVQVVSAVVTKAGKCYASTSTSGKVVKNLAAGNKLNVISGWSKKSGKVTWATTVVNGVCCYVDRSILLLTPELSGLSNTAEGVQVRWKAVSGATSYRIYYKGATGGWKSAGSVKGANVNRYVVKESLLTSGSQYSFTVRAVSGKRLSGYNAEGISGVFVQTPELVSATSNGKDRILLTWEPVENADRYQVYRKTTGGWKLLSTVTGNSYTDTAVKALTGYTYTVRAADGKNRSSYDAGGIQGMLILSSDCTTAKVLSAIKYRNGAGTSYQAVGDLKRGETITLLLGGTTRKDGYTWYRAVIGNQIRYVAGEYLLITPKPSKITRGSNSVTLQWTGVSGADSYLIYRKSTGSWKQIAAVRGSVTSYTDTSVSSGTSYTYTVRAETNGVRSGYDAAGISVAVLSAPNLTYITSEQDGITINWSRVTGADGYYVYRKSGSGSWTRVAKISSGDTISYLDESNLQKGTTYTYTVRAYAGKETSAYLTSGISVQAKYSVNVTTQRYVTTANVNYRDKAGTTGNVVGTLQKGAAVRVLPGQSVTVNGTPWYAIYLNDTVYYVNSTYLKAQ